MENYIGKGDKITVTGPSGGLSSGDPYVVGHIPCVCDVDIALSATGAASTKGIFDLAVTGTDNSGESSAEADVAVVVGAKLYYDSDGLSGNTTDTTFFGYALETVDAGATATINVLVK